MNGWPIALAFALIWALTILAGIGAGVLIVEMVIR